MSEPVGDARLRAHAELTRRLAARARGEGNDVLACELERQARDIERAIGKAA
jgi:hypothetical protein